MEEKITFNTENDINIKITKNEGGVLFDEDCCTCINIILTNDGKIATSFLGCHNPYIVMQLEKAQKLYFKELKKALKRDFKEYGILPEDDCDCKHEHCDCGCEDDHCNCEDEHCDCGDVECGCGDNCSCGCHEEEHVGCGKEGCTCTPENHCGCLDGKECKCESDHNCGCGEKKEENKKTKTGGCKGKKKK